MENGSEDTKDKYIINKKIVNQKNEELMRNLHCTLRNNSNHFKDLKKKVNNTYVITVLLYSLVFFLGLALLSVPLYYAFKGDIVTYNSIISGTLGITDLVVLFLFKPVERIHNLMGDMSQITIINTSFQEQVALRLIEMNVNEKKSVGESADHINDVTKSSMDLIEIYIESKYK
jgi:hypothetical protein